MQQRVSDVAVKMLHQLQRLKVPSSVQKNYSGTEWQQCSTPWRLYCMQVCLTDVLPGHADVCTRTCTTPHNNSTSSCPGVFTPTFLPRHPPSPNPFLSPPCALSSFTHLHHFHLVPFPFTPSPLLPFFSPLFAAPATVPRYLTSTRTARPPATAVRRCGSPYSQTQGYRSGWCWS